MHHDGERAGIVAGASAYVLWGLLTLYWHQLSGANAFELIGQRIVWSALILVIVSFRLAASIRETATRPQLAPRTGQLVPTRSGGVFVQEKGPKDGIPVVLFHGTAAWSELWRHTSDALAAAGFHVIVHAPSNDPAAVQVDHQ